MPTELAIIGAGGHAKVVVEAIRSGDTSYLVGVFDQDRKKQGSKLLQGILIAYLGDWAMVSDKVHIAIGDNDRRQTLCFQALDQGKELISVVHPAAQVSPSSLIDVGCFVAANTVVAAETQINQACIINHGCVIDHDCRVGEFSHIGPSATLGGGVHIGRGCLIGSGSTVLPGIRIGDYAIVGAGSVVTSDVRDRQKVVGVPAKRSCG